MENIGDAGSKVWGKVHAMLGRCSKLRCQPRELVEYAKGQLGSKLWLKGIFVMVLLVAGGMAVYLTGAKEAENTAGGTKINRMDAGRLVAHESQRLNIKGLEEASLAKTLGNPFSPDHRSAAAVPAKENKQGMASRQVDKEKGKTASRHQEAPVSAASVPRVQAEQTPIYLQGIIDMEGRPGALLNWQGQNKFLLAGESWQGYTVEGIEENNIVLGGHRLNVGESLLI